MPRLIALCQRNYLPDGGSRGFDPLRAGRDTMFVVRRGDTLYGWHDACPHWGGTPLPWRRHAYLSGDRQHIVCAAHGARFDIETGQCVLGPCLGQSLTPVPLIQTEDGAVCVAAHTLQETTP